MDGHYLLLAPPEEGPRRLVAALAGDGATVTWLGSAAVTEGLLATADALLVQPGGEPLSIADDWLAWVMQVCRFRSEQAVVVFGDDIAPHERSLLIDAGVSGIYPSSADPKVASAMLTATRRRGRARASEALELHLDARALVVSNALASVRLSAREFALLAFLLHHRGRVQSREALMAGVWGDLFGVEERTVDTTLSRLRRRLKGELGLSHAIRTVPQGGYLIDAAAHTPAASGRLGAADAGVWLAATEGPARLALLRLCEANGLPWRALEWNRPATPAGVGLVLAGAEDGWLATVTEILERWPDAVVMVVDAGADGADLCHAAELGIRGIVPQRWAEADLRCWLGAPARSAGSPATPSPLELLPEAFAARVWGAHHARSTRPSAISVGRSALAPEKRLLPSRRWSVSVTDSACGELERCVGRRLSSNRSRCQEFLTTNSCNKWKIL